MQRQSKKKARFSLGFLGDLKAKPAKPAEPVTPAAPTPQKRRFGLAPLAAALAALLIVIAGGAWWFLDANRPASVAAKAPAEGARLSIVVLPFANLSGDPGRTTSSTR